MSELVRINKWFSQNGIASRREAEKWITEGRVSINGKKLQDLGHKIDPDVDKVALDGKPLVVQQAPRVYWMLHKPDRFLCSTVPEEDKPTVFDLPRLAKLSFKVNFVGRLDYRTEGLLLLTNDGELVHRLTHPKFKVPRHYFAVVNKKLTREQISEIKRGVKLEDGIAKAKIEIGHGLKLGATTGSLYQITVFEGRNRLVRRLFEHYGIKVVRLYRYGFGDIRLEDSLKPGDYRQLTSQEIRYLKGEDTPKGEKK